MSVPELPSNNSSPEETFTASLGRVYILIDDMRSDLTKSQERLQTLFNYIITQHQTFELQMKPQTLFGSDLSLSKDDSLNIFVSTDTSPDFSSGLDPVQGISQVFH